MRVDTQYHLKSLAYRLLCADICFVKALHISLGSLDIVSGCALPGGEMNAERRKRQEC